MPSNAQLQEFRRTLMEIRMRELQTIETEHEHERDLPVPGPDRMPISPTERDQAQDRMIAEVEREDHPHMPRPPELPSLSAFRDRQKPAECQPGRSPDTGARSLGEWRAQRQPEPNQELEREPDRER